jgi:hypothetical protein
MRVTISMPSFERPKRTIRAIESVCLQTANGWEALIVGDSCPVIHDLLASNYFESMVKEAESKGNKLSISNNSTRCGGWGFQIINQNIHRALGSYFMFMSNDDVILPTHFEEYLSGIENTNYDFVYYNSFVEPLNEVRVSQLENGKIGHSELIIRTDFLRTMPPHIYDYGHDWFLVRNMCNATNRHVKVENKQPTYIVKALGELRNDTID